MLDLLQSVFDRDHAHGCGYTIRLIERDQERPSVESRSMSQPDEESWRTYPLPAIEVCTTLRSIPCRTKAEIQRAIAQVTSQPF